MKDTSSWKGMGRAYSGAWKPAKKEDERFLGKPGEIKTSYTAHGEKIQTHIGQDGRADREIHFTDHGNAKMHDNPHEHMIAWDEQGPHWGKAGRGEKQFVPYGGMQKMSPLIGTNSFEENRFKSISDFKWCMERGGEVNFEWNGVMYCCFGCVPPSPGAAPRMLISQAGSVEVNERTEMWGDTADDILEYMVGTDRLRDVITKVKVWWRAI